jgi:hypothetical protein
VDFFASGHGKGEHDGAGVVVKKELQKEQLRLNVAPLQNAQDVVKFLKETFAKEYVGLVDSRVDVMWVFWEVKSTNVDRIQPYICVIVFGFHKMHSISSLDHEDLKPLLMHELSCFYPTCVDGVEEEDCNNIKHALPWKTIKLVPIELAATREIMDDG